MTVLFVTSWPEAFVSVVAMLVMGAVVVTVVLVLRPPRYHAKSGKVLTDADIERLANEAERGYDVSELHPVEDDSVVARHRSRP